VYEPEDSIDVGMGKVIVNVELYVLIAESDLESFKDNHILDQ
jgi:hypothetical protein